MKKINNEKGFTLLELIISLAILALLMTAVCGLMGFNTINYKKTKADIVVQDNAQATYDNISDAVMQAKRIEIEGYVPSGEIVFTPSDIGKAVDVDVSTMKYVKASELDEMEDTAGYDSFYALKEKNTDGSGVVTTTYQKIYLKKLVVEYAVPIDASSIPGATVANDTVSFTSNGEAYDLPLSAKDTCTATYVFENNNIYLSRTYKYMTSLNDTYNESSEDEKKQCIYSEKLNYVIANGDAVSGACATVDATNNSIGIDLSFAERSMSYTTNGMINIRNSYVLNDIQ